MAKYKVDEHYAGVAHKFSEELEALFMEGRAAIPGWLKQKELGYGFQSDLELVAAFDAGGAHLAKSSFGMEILEEWREEREYGKEHDPSYTMATFMEDLGYLEDFTGRNLTQLVRFYLSSRGASSGSWLHTGTWAQEQGTLVAHAFYPPAFREHDSWVWVGDSITLRGYAVGYSEL